MLHAFELGGFRVLDHLIDVIDDQQYPLALFNTRNLEPVQLANDLKIVQVVEYELVLLVNLV
jgi:hypothetical protein